MVTKGFLVFLGSIVLVGLVITWVVDTHGGPTKAAASVSTPANVEKPRANVVVDGVVDFGNGVYYFQATGFGKALSAFLDSPLGGNHCRVLTVTGDGDANKLSGGNAGYFVVCLS